MSLVGLLAKLGPRAPKWVTVNGEVVTNGVVHRPDGYHHPRHGIVTPVKKHEFHGGDEPPEGDDTRPWWERDPGVLEREQARMAVSFPKFALCRGRGVPEWVGTLNTGRGRFRVRVTHLPDRSVIPLVEVLHPARLGRQEGWRFVRPDHLYGTNHLCVAAQEDWDPEADDAVTVLAWTAHWLAVYAEWRVRGGEWPLVGYAA